MVFYDVILKHGNIKSFRLAGDMILLIGELPGSP